MNINDAKTELRQARAFSRAPRPEAVEALFGTRDLEAAFVEAGLCRESAMHATRGLLAGRYVDFSDAAVAESSGPWKSRKNPDVTAGRIAAVESRLDSSRVGTRLVERSTLCKVSERAVAVVEAAADGTFGVQVLTPGWGSSGHYSPAVCEAAAPLVKVGTHMYFDHPTESDRLQRPERSVRDLAAVITEAGRWDARGQRIVARFKPVERYASLIEDLAPHIGVSIMGSATDITTGEAEGRRGPIIEGLAAIDSVDFVTRAGRGGKVLSVLESAGGSNVVQSARRTRTAWGRPLST